MLANRRSRSPLCLLGAALALAITAIGCGPPPGTFQIKLNSRNRAVATAQALIEGRYEAEKGTLTLRIVPRALLPAASVRPNGREYRVWARPNPEAPWKLLGVLDPHATFGPFSVPGRQVEIWVTAEATKLAYGPTMEPIFTRVVRAP